MDPNDRLQASYVWQRQVKIRGEPALATIRHRAGTCVWYCGVCVCIVLGCLSVGVWNVRVCSMWGEIFYVG